MHCMTDYPTSSRFGVELRRRMCPISLFLLLEVLRDGVFCRIHNRRRKSVKSTYRSDRLFRYPSLSACVLNMVENSTFIFSKEQKQKGKT